MMTLRGAITQLLLRRYARGDLPPSVAAWVRAGIEEDAGLSETYTTLRRAERVAARGAPLSAAQEEMLERAVLATLGERQTQRQTEETRSKPRLVRAAPLAAACASLALFMFVDGGSRDVTYGAGELEMRGAELARAPLGVKVACLVGTQVVDSATVGVRRPSDALTCKQDAMLAYSLTNLSPSARFVFIIGVAADGTTRWYAPFHKRASALRVDAGRSNELLPTLGDTRGMADDERVSLYVLLSDRPFNAEDIERQLDGARARGAQLAGVERLPLPDVPVQARVDMDRTQ